jgi:hypothetical protein
MRSGKEISAASVTDVRTGACASAASGRFGVTTKSRRGDGRPYFDCRSASANGGLAFGGAGGGGVDAGDLSGGSVRSTQFTALSGFGVRCSSSNMRSTRAARSSAVLTYNMHQSALGRRSTLLNCGHRASLVKVRIFQRVSIAACAPPCGWRWPTRAAPRWVCRGRWS